MTFPTGLDSRFLPSTIPEKTLVGLPIFFLKSAGVVHICRAGKRRTRFSSLSAVVEDLGCPSQQRYRRRNGSGHLCKALAEPVVPWIGSCATIGLACTQRWIQTHGSALDAMAEHVRVPSHLCVKT